MRKKHIIILVAVVSLVALVIGALLMLGPRREADSMEHADDVVFLLGAEGTIKNTQIEIEGRRYEVSIITLSLGIENKSDETLNVAIGPNIQLIHPLVRTDQDLFKLLKKEKGPYAVRVKTNDTQFQELQFIQKPGTPPLTDHVLVSVVGGTYVQRVGLQWDTE